MLMKTAQIISLFIGGWTTLAVFAKLARTCAVQPKKAEKRERGEILKQLVELSEQENKVSAIAGPNARRRYSHNSPVPIRPKQTDAEIEEEIRQPSKVKVGATPS